MEDNQAVCKICKAGGSTKLAHMGRGHRINSAAIAETFLGGVANLIYERTENEAADIGTKRFTDPMAWVKVLSLAQIVADSFWTEPDYKSYMASLFKDGLPHKPAGSSKPWFGTSSKLRPRAGQYATWKPKAKPKAPPRPKVRQPLNLSDSANRPAMPAPEVREWHCPPRPVNP